MKSVKHFTQIFICTMSLLFIIIGCQKEMDFIWGRDYSDTCSLDLTDPPIVCKNVQDCYNQSKDQFYQFSYRSYLQAIQLADRGLSYSPVSMEEKIRLNQIKGFALLFAGYWLLNKGWEEYQSYFQRASIVLETLQDYKDFPLDDPFMEEILLYEMGYGLFLRDYSLVDKSENTLMEINHISPLFSYFQWLYHKGDAFAFSHLQDSLREDPNFFPARLDLILTHIDQKEYQIALQQLQNLAVFHRHHNDLHFNLGLLYLLLDENSKAIHSLKRANELEPCDQVALNLLEQLP